MHKRRKRLDEVLIEKGTAADTNAAFIFVTEGRVFVNGQKAVSPSQVVGEDATVEVREEKKYVGWGACKLEAALNEFKIDVYGKICADIGSATGGFVQVLLERGAKKVYAIDTAVGKLALKLRRDPRVVVMESSDVRDLEALPDAPEIVTIDVSLISLRQILAAVRRFLPPHPGGSALHESHAGALGKKKGTKRKGLVGVGGLTPEGEIIALFKPQYETRDKKILRHGIITDAVRRRKLLDDFIERAKSDGFEIIKWIESPIKGSEGNTEYLIQLKS